MVFIIRRREACSGGTAAMALALARRPTRQAHSEGRRRRRPSWTVEKGATLRLLRPARFVEPDEVIFRANSAKFAKEFGVEVKVDLVGWEDIRQQTAVSANTGAGPDIILGWAESPHIYADKVIELSRHRRVSRQEVRRLDVPRREVRQEGQDQQLDRPADGRLGRTARLSRVGAQGSRLRQDPDRPAGLLKLCQELKKINKPAGFALGNAVGDANGFANWMLWSHGAHPGR